MKTLLFFEGVYYTCTVHYYKFSYFMRILAKNMQETDLLKGFTPKVLQLILVTCGT